MANLIDDIWCSFRRLPAWVQVWVAAILVPANLAALAFVVAPMGALIAVVAIAGMAPNIVVMTVEKGFSKLMALPHILIWTPL